MTKGGKRMRFRACVIIGDGPMRGILTEPTEAAWQEACDRLGIRSGVLFP